MINDIYKSIDLVSNWHFTGACTVVEGQELCKCAEGYLGPHCNKMLDQCMNIECMNSGECEQGACVCSLGFTG